MSTLKKIGIYILSVPAYIVLVVATIATIVLGSVFLIIVVPFAWIYYLIKKGWKGILNGTKEEYEVEFAKEWMKRNGYDES